MAKCSCPQTIKDTFSMKYLYLDTALSLQIWCLGETSEQSINITVEGKAPTLFVITNLTPGKKYNIKVSAISVKGAVLESNVQQLQLGKIEL